MIDYVFALGFGLGLLAGALLAFIGIKAYDCEHCGTRR